MSYGRIGLGGGLAVAYRRRMLFRQFLNDETACASCLLGCKTHGKLAVVDAHADLVDDYVAVAALTDDVPPAPERQAEIVAANRSGRVLTQAA